MTLFLAAMLLVAFQRPVAAPVGAPAPSFTAQDDHGVSHSLSGFRGRYVVLEWHEKGCPYVTKHYRSGAMQKLQAEWRARGVVWLLLNSSATGFHSSLTPDASRAYFKGVNAAATAALLDSSGVVGKLYGVTTALHMVIVDPNGTTVYNGAIDDRPKTEAPSLIGATNYVDAALTELFAGKAVTTPSSVPYGCDIHYAPVR